MKWWIKLGLALVAALSLWVGMPYFSSAETQARKQHEKLFSLAEGRNWIEVKSLLSEHYEDVWGNRQNDAIEGAKEVFQGFIVLELQMDITELLKEDEQFLIHCHIKVAGSGAGFSQPVMKEVKRLKEPWIFTWRKEGSKPSDWRLVKVEQPELRHMSMPQF